MVKRLILKTVTFLICYLLLTIALSNPTKAQSAACYGDPPTTGYGFCATSCSSFSNVTGDGQCVVNSAWTCCIPPVECHGVQTGGAGYCQSNRYCPTSDYHVENVNNNNDCQTTTNGGQCCVTSPQPTNTPTQAVGCQPGQDCCRCSVNGSTHLCTDIITNNCISPDKVPVCTSNILQCTSTLGCSCTLSSNLNCGHYLEPCCTTGIRCFPPADICQFTATGTICTTGGALTPAPPPPCPPNNVCRPDICNCTGGTSMSCSNANGTTGTCCCPVASQPTEAITERPYLNPVDGCTNGINTAVGCIPLGSSSVFVAYILGWSVGIAGGIALILIVVSSFIIMTSQGDPRRLQAGKELLTAAVTGLLLLIFSVFILDLLGVRILKLPGF